MIGYGVSQISKTRSGRVLGETTFDGRDRGSFNVVGCVEIRLASTKVDDIDTLTLQALNRRQYLLGFRRGNAAKARREWERLRHERLFRCPSSLPFGIRPTLAPIL